MAHKTKKKSKQHFFSADFEKQNAFASFDTLLLPPAQAERMHRQSAPRFTESRAFDLSRAGERGGDFRRGPARRARPALTAAAAGDLA